MGNRPLGGSSGKSQLSLAEQQEIEKLEEASTFSITEKLVLAVLSLLMIGSIIHFLLKWLG